MLAVAAGVAVAAACLLARVPPPAEAHRLGKPAPDVQILTQSTPQVTWLISVRLVDQDSRQPIKGATVRLTPSMAEPHRMILPAVPLAESPYVDGLYSGPVTFLHPARWTLDVDVGGPVVPVRKQIHVTVPAAGGGEGARARADPQVVSTSVDVRLGGREWVNLAVLAGHLAAGVGWVTAMLIAGFGSWRPELTRLVGGSWVAAGIMIASGAYNSAHNMPVAVEWQVGPLARHLAEFERVPFGWDYGVLLLAKHALVLMMLGGLVGLTVTARSHGRPERQHWPHRLVRATGVLGGLVVLQSVGLGYLHRLIAHF
jgi:hypothetical protein